MGLTSTMIIMVRYIYFEIYSLFILPRFHNPFLRSIKHPWFSLPRLYSLHFLTPYSYVNLLSIVSLLTSPRFFFDAKHVSNYLLYHFSYLLSQLLVNTCFTFCSIYYILSRFYHVIHLYHYSMLTFVNTIIQLLKQFSPLYLSQHAYAPFNVFLHYILLSCALLVHPFQAFRTAQGIMLVYCYRCYGDGVMPFSLFVLMLHLFPFSSLLS